MKTGALIQFQDVATYRMMIHVLNVVVSCNK